MKTEKTAVLAVTSQQKQQQRAQQKNPLQVLICSP